MIIFQKKYILFILLAGSMILGACRKTSKSRSVSKTAQSKASAGTSVSPAVMKVIASAKSYIGTPYRMGGATRAGIDCSGLICTSFKSIDQTLPRTSQEQSRLGRKISLNDLREGDLVFFTDKKGRTKVTHVGMVTKINGRNNVRFIHASTKLGVVESDLYADYYLSVFLFAVRIIN